MATDTTLRMNPKEVDLALGAMATDHSANFDIFARAAWSIICEPGDGFAGCLVSILGPVRALELLIAGLESNSVERSLNQVGFSLDTLPGFENGQKYLNDARARWSQRLSSQAVFRALEYIRSVGGSLLVPDEGVWANGLADLGSFAPFALWVRGRTDVLGSNLSLAIVGSRGVTEYGRRVTAELTYTASQLGAVIVSGGALGVDAVAHQTALASEPGTIAVLAGGVDRLYPSANRLLLERICSEGAVVGELPPGSAPSKWRFLQRNRLIAALGHATLVTEANWRSGALSTARHAVALNRTVGAVPGPIYSPKSAGCNQLIEAGQASLVSGTASLRDLLPLSGAFEVDQPIAGLGAIETRVLDAIGFGQESLEIICREAGLTRNEAKFGLAQLELAGLVERRGSDWRQVQTNL